MAAQAGRRDGHGHSIISGPAVGRAAARLRKNRGAGPGRPVRLARGTIMTIVMRDFKLDSAQAPSPVRNSESEVTVPRYQVEPQAQAHSET
jgi:hypothetical protein